VIGCTTSDATINTSIAAEAFSRYDSDHAEIARPVSQDQLHRGPDPRA
jgi:hypothetical protein